MAITYRDAKIISNEEVSSGIFKMVVEDDSSIKAGQFYMLKYKGSKTLLPRPISICEKNDNTLTFLYAVVGNGTKDAQKSLLSRTILQSSNINHVIINYLNANEEGTYQSAIGTLVNAKCVRFEPAAIITKENIDTVIERMDEAIADTKLEFKVSKREDAKYDIEDDKKIQIINNNDTYYLNDKVIIFKNKIDSNEYKNYFKSVIINYLMQVIPSTAIFVLENFEPKTDNSEK